MRPRRDPPASPPSLEYALAAAGCEREPQGGCSQPAQQAQATNVCSALA